MGSAGGQGTPHLEWLADIVREIAYEENLSFKMALIDSEIDKRCSAERFAGRRDQTMWRLGMR